ncbi:MAG: KR domain-containing protein, partial [Pseudoalteromonas sp.]|nr:KR domain-containing protein [Pseudoalteromonas sp.]
MFSSNCGQPVVLASGGAGGIGRAVTTYFQGNRVLPVLLSRRKRNSHFGESTVKATAFENSALRKSLQRLPQGQQLKHVLHLAAVLWDINMSLGTTEMTDYVLKPKVFGAWNMHSLTTGGNLSSFVLFSSITSLFGSMGQSSYAAANCFLDQLAAFRRDHGLSAVSINWGMWGEVGLAASLARQPAMAVIPMSTEECI